MESKDILYGTDARTNDFGDVLLIDNAKLYVFGFQ